MAKLSLEELKSLVDSTISASDISNDTFTASRNNSASLVDKIGRIVTLDTVYTIDKLNRFDGEFMNLGKTIEEWAQDLVLPVAFDSNGSTTLAPHMPTYRPNFYSYTIGEKTIPTTVRNNDLERAVNNAGELASIVAMTLKRLEDSLAQYKYQVKKEILGTLIGMCESAMDASNATTFVASTAYSTINTIYKDANNVVGILVKAYGANDATDFDDAVEKGYIVKLDLLTEIAKPVDTATGEAFIKQVKADMEIASDVSEGHSLNGNTLGVTESLVLIVKQGVIPALEVDTYAGAFNKGDIAIPSEIIVVNGFGSADSDFFAVLMDSRGMRLHPTYNATRTQDNAQGDFINYYRHTENTAYISRNTFVKVYKAP